MAKAGTLAVAEKSAPPAPPTGVTPTGVTPRATKVGGVTLPRISLLSLYVRTFGTADGYGNAAEQIALALEARRVTVALSGPTAPTGFSNAEHIAKRQPIAGQAIVWFTPPASWEKQRAARPSFGFSMYESDRFPPNWLERLDAVDEIWVPCQANAELFKSATSRPVHVIPLGVDAQAFAYAKRERGQKLRVLFNTTYANDVRKGAGAAIKAFQDAFPGRDDVELVMRTTYGVLAKANDARISIQNGPRLTSQLAEIYRSCDVLLNPSCGEGFGLISLEAMATGMPAIFGAGMDCGTDYADFGLPVKTRPIPALSGQGPAPWGNWQEPYPDLLVDRLREVDQQYDRVMERAAKDAAAIAEVWTWENTAKLIAARLEA